MKAWVIYTLSILAALVIIAAVIYGLRLFTNISTPITVHQVQPGITCAVMTTTDSVAMSCWKD